MLTSATQSGTGWLLRSPPRDREQGFRMVASVGLGCHAWISLRGGSGGDMKPQAKHALFS